MYIPLVPCPTCGRHVRCTESACPFCRKALPAGLTPIPAASRRLARGAAFMFASSLAVAGAGCGSDDTVTTPPTDATADDGTPAPKYGLPDAFFDTSDADDGMDDGTPVVKYGGPPVDTGPADAPIDADDGSPAPKYGLPADTGTG